MEYKNGMSKEEYVEKWEAIYNTYPEEMELWNAGEPLGNTYPMDLVRELKKAYIGDELLKQSEEFTGELFEEEGCLCWLEGDCKLCYDMECNREKEDGDLNKVVLKFVQMVSEDIE